MANLRSFRPVSFIIFLVLIFTCLLPAFSNTYDTSRPPQPPSSPPPRIGSASAKVPVDNSGKVVLNFKLAAGWSIISFPVASIDSASGFTHKIYRYESGGYYPFDPVNEPCSVSTRYGYFAWADDPVEVQVIGTPNTGQIRSIPLAPGWNLVGCPGVNPVLMSRIVVYEGNNAYSLSNAMKAGKSGSRLISPGVFASGSLSEPVNLGDKSASTRPGGSAWIFAYHPVKLTVAGRETGGSVPHIKTINPPQVVAGDEISISGTSFSNNPGFVMIGGIRVPNENLLSWEDSRICLKTPVQAASGQVVVYSNRTAGNSFPLKVKPLDYADGILEGNVVDNKNHPLPGARVLLDNGQLGVTNASGYYIIKDIPTGSHSLNISKMGYRTAKGNVNIKQGRTEKVLVSLTPVSGIGRANEVLDPPPSAPSNSPIGAIENGSGRRVKSDNTEKGCLQVIVDAYDDGDHRWWPRKIEVTEVGNLNYHWYKDWDNDYGDSWYELDCDGVRVGKTYRIKVQWRSKNGGRPQSNDWDRKVYKKDQTETIDSLY